MRILWVKMTVGKKNEKHHLLKRELKSASMTETIENALKKK